MVAHKVYLKMCQDLAGLSKCSKHTVGALLVKNNRIISNGINGTPPGYTNCCDKFHGTDVHAEPGKSQHREWSEKFEIHAEMNAILYAEKVASLEGSVLYCSLEPCFHCLKHAITVGVKAVYYAKKHKYNLETPEALDLIHTLGIKIKHINIE